MHNVIINRPPIIIINDKYTLRLTLNQCIKYLPEPKPEHEPQP